MEVGWWRSDDHYMTSLFDDILNESSHMHIQETELKVGKM